MKQRWISILTAIALVVAMIPCASLAAEPETASGAAYAAAGETGEPEAASEAEQPADQPAAPSGQESGSGETGEPETDPEQQTEEELQLPEGQEGQAGAQEQEEPQASEPQESDADQGQESDADQPQESDADQGQESDADQGQEPEAAQDQQPAEEPQLSQPQESPAGETGAPELSQQQDQQPADQRQAPYEAGYNSANQTVEVPYEVLGSAMNGKDIFLAQVLDDQGRTLAELKGKKDKAQSMMVFTMPYDVNLTAGTYSFRITLRQSWTGTEVVLEDQVVLKLDQGIQGIHLINTEIRYDGTDQGTFTLKFQNGTGDNRITSIDKVKFSTRLEDGSTTSMNLTQSTSGYTYDLDKGELYIPNAFFADRTLDPVVYFVGMDFTLANGQKITCNPLELTPDHSVPVEGFVNPGDQAWYFMYEPKTQPEEPYDVSYPGPNKTVEISFDVFGDALTNRDQVSALVLDELGNPVAQLDGKKDNFRDVVVLTMPYDLDLAAGTYDLRFQLRWSESGEESQLDGYATLTLDQAIQGIHLINTEVRYDGTDEGSYVLKFQNGTGDNRITDISEVQFMTRMEDGSTEGFGLRAGTDSFTWDPDRGEITIPASSFARQELAPVVYFGMMDFTLANGETITANSLEVVPDEAVLPGDFVNDGSNNWFLINEIGVELSGSVKTWGEAEPVTLTLTKEGEGQVGEPLTLEPEVQQYVFSNLLPGTYTLTASKHNHVTRTYTIEVGDSPLEQNIELCLLGDVNGDGKVTTLDAALVNACAQQVTQLNEYAYACADVTGDGIVSTFDAARINAHAQKVSSLWN